MLNIESIITGGGVLLIGLIIFAESGLFLGFFLPGDTLLLTAGFFASQGLLNLPTLIICVAIGAIAGDNLNYSIGRRTGHKIFRKESGLLFHKDHIVRAEKFYESHGGKTILVARFIPVVRALGPLIAGVGKMPRRRFVVFNTIGVIIWSFVITLAGYWLGNRFGDKLEDYLLPIFAVAIILTFAPSIIHVLRDKKSRKYIAEKLTSWQSKIRRK